MRKRVYDVAFKKMAVALSDAKGPVKGAAEELDPGRISKWRNRYNSGTIGTLVSNLTDEQKETRRLQKELKEAQQERDILKKAVGIFSRGEGRYSDL